jgi:hypothetical protein
MDLLVIQLQGRRKRRGIKPELRNKKTNLATLDFIAETWQFIQRYFTTLFFLIFSKYYSQVYIMSEIIPVGQP